MTNKKIFFQPVNWGDFSRKTSHLNLTEKGAYLMLMQAYWENGGCLPVDKGRLKPGHQPGLMPGLSDALYRACGAHTKDERQAVDTVLEEFFPMVDGKHVNDEIDEVLERIKATRQRLSESGKRGAQVKASRGKPTLKPGLSQATSPAEAIHNHNLKEKVLTPNPLTVDKSVDNVGKGEDQGFKSFDQGGFQGEGEVPRKWDVRHHLTEQTRGVLKAIAKAKHMEFDFLMDVYNEGMKVNGGTRRDVLPYEQLQGAVVNWAKSYAGRKAFS